MEAQPITDDLLPARELALDPGPFIVLTVALPAHPPFFSDYLDETVTRGGVIVRRWAEHDIGTGWNHHLCSRMTLVQGGVQVGSVITAIAHEELDETAAKLGELC